MSEAPNPLMQGWRIDKHVPAALILTIFLQTAGAIWWASSINYRVGQLEAEIFSAADQSGRIIRLETQMVTLNQLLQRIDDKLDRALSANRTR